jgi:hypothetical protein
MGRSRPSLLPPALLLVALCAAVALAATAADLPAYDPATETFLAGTVSQVSYPETATGSKDLRLVLDTGAVNRQVHVGPARYVEGQGFSFRPGMRIVVSGSLAKSGGHDLLLAREIELRDRRLVLRAESGRPLWEGSAAP